VKESACQFGPHRQLAGILTEPEVSTQRRAVVLVSAGVTPKFGPFRLYVELARRLGRAGYRTLRFDLGGIGDSGEAYGGYPLEQRTSLQIKAALDHLSERFQLDGIVLAGLCSGADDSFRHAERDERVSAVVMVDPFAYRTVGFLWRHFLFRAQRRLLRAVGLYRPPPRNRAASLVDYEHLPAAESRRILCELLGRQVQLHFVYTGGMREHFNHRGQLRTMFRGVSLTGHVSVDYLPELDHTQLFQAERRILIEAIVERLASSTQDGVKQRPGRP
jgi:pimeloyl-ACP methyl ester carboxylesterase